MNAHANAPVEKGNTPAAKEPRFPDVAVRPIVDEPHHVTHICGDCKDSVQASRPYKLVLGVLVLCAGLLLFSLRLLETLASVDKVYALGAFGVSALVLVIILFTFLLWGARLASLEVRAGQLLDVLDAAPDAIRAFMSNFGGGLAAMVPAFPKYMADLIEGKRDNPDLAAPPPVYAPQALVTQGELDLAIRSGEAVLKRLETLDASEAQAFIRAQQDVIDTLQRARAVFGDAPPGRQ